MQAGTMSKIFFPGVRLGWAVGPADISARLVSAKQNTDQCAGALGQRLFEESVRRGWIDEQLVRSRSLYWRKCERMLAALERWMPDGAHWTRPEGGFFLLAHPPRRRRFDRGCPACGRARGRHRARNAVPDGCGADTLRLSFSMISEAEIDDGIERLAPLLTPRAT